MRSARTIFSGPSNLAIEDLDAGDIPGKVWISCYLYPQDA